MATSRKESQPNARTNRAVRNMSPVLKPSESDQGLLRRARSVPSSPDHRSSASTVASSSSSNACRPSSSSFNPRSTASSRSSTSSFNPRSTASSRSSTSSSSSSSSSTHGKTTPLLHSVSAVVGAKQATGIMRRRADKSTGATSVWPHALATPSTTTSPADKDPASRAAKSPSSNAQKSKLSSTRPGAEKTAATPSPKPRTQKAAGAAGKTQAASSSARIPAGAMAKGRTGMMEISVPSIQRTTSVPVAAAAPKAHQEQDVELLMGEFDEMESISTPSIEEHLQQRLPDPVDVTPFATSEQAPTPSEPSSNNLEEHENDQEAITENMFAEEKRDYLNGGDNADDVAKEAAAEIIELLKEAELNEAAIEMTGLKESVGEIELKGDVDEPKLNGADGETELKEAADGEAAELKDPELAVKEEANEERIILPATKATEAVQRWRTNEVTEEGRSKTTTQERRNKVMALVGRFETAMSGRE